MSEPIRRLYIVVAMVWGSILGALSFQVIGGGVAGILWIFVFGDNAWPKWAWMIVYTVAGVAAIVVFCACVFAGWSYSQKVPGEGSQTKNHYHRLSFLFVLSFVVILGYVAYANYRDKTNALISQQRVEVEGKRKDDSLLHQKTGESDVNYYCRSILSRPKIDVFYHGHRIKLVQEMLIGKGVLFAVVAPYHVVKSLAREMIVGEEITNGNRKMITEFVALPENVSCGHNMYFIGSAENKLPSSLLYVKKLYGEIPSVGVGFTFHVRH